MRTILLLAAALLPSCVLAGGGNRATTRDVEKPTGEPRVPESQYATVAFDAAGMTPAIYETPADRALVIHDLRVSVPCDVMAEVVGAPLVLLPASMFEPPSGGTSAFLVFRSPSGVRVPASAKLRLQRATGAQGAETAVFFSGELVRL
ncbi:MAG TPA: hypothetical protein VKE69_13180 [Planctomycetota bacterium]|nr:hypothetical protein [Planctomycetota bacterium]